MAQIIFCLVLILTEEMDDIGDLSISGVGSLDDLSTF